MVSHDSMKLFEVNINYDLQTTRLPIMRDVKKFRVHFRQGMKEMLKEEIIWSRKIVNLESKP